MPRGTGIASEIYVSFPKLFILLRARPERTNPISVEFPDGRKLSELIISIKTQFRAAVEYKLTLQPT
jgi:hypothetical protein